MGTSAYWGTRSVCVSRCKPFPCKAAYFLAFPTVTECSMQHGCNTAVLDVPFAFVLSCYAVRRQFRWKGEPLAVGTRMTDAPRTFELRSCRDMIKKMERELDRVKSAGLERGALTDHGINFAWTAWHMAEWVWRDMTAAQRCQVALEAKTSPIGFKCEEFQHHLCRISHDLTYCRIIATAAKHSACRFGAEIDFDPDISLGPSFTAAGAPASQRTWILKMDVGDDRVLASDVFDRVMSFWTSFVYGRQIDRED